MRIKHHSYRRIFLLLLALTCAFFTLLSPLAPSAYAHDIASGISQSNTSDDPTSDEENTSDKGHVVLIMTSALQWESLADYNAPYLRDLAASGAMGNMVPISTRGASCPLNSWLTLSAGAKTTNSSLSTSVQCETPPIVPGTRVGRYTYTRYAHFLNGYIYHQRNLEGYGTLSQALAQADVTVSSIGTGAAYVMTGGADTYPYQWQPAPHSDAHLGEVVAESARNYNLTIVDADIAQAISEEDYPDFPNLSKREAAKKRAEYYDEFLAQQEQANAQRVEAILQHIPEGTRVVVVSLLNREKPLSQMTIIGDIGDTSATFKPVVPGLLYSASVRREGALQLTDIDPTILSWFALTRPPEMSGASLIDNPVGDAQPCNYEQPCFTDRLDTLVDDSSLFTLTRDIRHQFLNSYHAIASLFILASILLTATPLWKRLLGRRKGLRALWIWLGYTLAAFPLSAILANLYTWWRADSPLLVYMAFAWLGAGIFGLLALAARRIHRLAPLFVILVPTALFILVDTINGSKAMADSAIGFNTLAAARFYGLGNEAYSLLAASSLFILAFLGVWLREHFVQAGRSASIARAVAVSVVGILGFIIVAVDALPRYGADFGGALSYLPALLILLILLSEAKVRPRTALVIAGATVVFAVLIAFADWLRPASSRTHLGNFFQSILDGRLFSVIGNKLETNLHLLVSSGYTFIVLRGLLLLLIVLLPALAARKVLTRSEKLELAQQKSEDTADEANPLSAWQKLTHRAKHVKEVLVDFHARYWSHLFPPSLQEAPATRWPALRIMFIVEVVVFILSFAVNDSGIVLPAMAMLLLLPMLTSLVIDGLPVIDSHDVQDSHDSTDSQVSQVLQES